MSLSRSSSTVATTAIVSITAVACILATSYYFDLLHLLSDRQQQRLSSRKVKPRCYDPKTPPSLAAFKALTSQVTTKQAYSLASDVQHNIPIYNALTLNLADQAAVSALQDEFHDILLHGPGVFVLKHFFPDPSVIDTANAAFASIAAQELRQHRDSSGGGGGGDHFAASSANLRIWNSFSKHALESPHNFLRYYSNPLFALVCTAYLGPGYRITAQLNVVRPGGKPQVAHRDYHLGFQTAEQIVRWPKAAHAASAMLTLQGAVAHADMPLESGPTRFLPFSQQFGEGYIACRSDDFETFFLENWVSAPLAKGDAVFFSPAIFHAAGENRTQGVERSANLMQISSAFGKPMEMIDSSALIEHTFESLEAKYNAEGMSAEVNAFVQAVAEGYPFPTNLDRRQPAAGGLTPESEQDVVRRALCEKWDKVEMIRVLLQMKHDAAA